MAKEKINDDTLLQLIRDGNSRAEASRRLGVGRAEEEKGSDPDLALFSPCSPINPGAEKIFHLCFLPLLLPFLVAASIAASGCRFARPNPR